MKNTFKFIICIALSLSPVVVPMISAQTGGGYEITQSVIAGGGGQNSTGGTFSLDGTIGQSVAGGAQKYPYILQSGFWNSAALFPTAAAATIEGRIVTADGRGVRSVLISLTDATTNETRTTRSTAFGYYRFEDVIVGQTYILTANAKRFTFNPNTRAISPLEDLAEEDFVALPVGK